MNTLVAKLAMLLAAAFALVGSVLLIATQTMFDPARLVELAAYVMVASIAFALMAALCAFQLFTRRLTRLSDAVETIAQGGFHTPLRVPGADAGGDEIDRLAAQVQRMADRIADQLAALDQAVAQRSELLANVSHDLRTPLASMQGYLELLLLRHGTLPAAEERNYLETAVRHSERLGRLVGDLFELTALEAQEAQPRPEDFSLGELAQDVVQKFALDARRREVRLHTGGGDDGVALHAHADIGMVERVLVNLLDNALRHTPAGGSVTIELGRTAQQRARLSVRDTGPGIAAADLAGLFARYDRADRSAPGGPGGLGLAIARRIVQLHDGELSVQSTPGSGSCFSFDLPLAQTTQASATRARRSNQRMSG